MSGSSIVLIAKDFPAAHCRALTAHFDIFSTAVRVEVNVLISDSLGIVVTKGATIHFTPYGMSRVSDTASHCTYTPPSFCSSRQYEFRRQRNPLSWPAGFSFSDGVSGLSISAIFVECDQLYSLVGESGPKCAACSV